MMIGLVLVGCSSIFKNSNKQSTDGGKTLIGISVYYCNTFTGWVYISKQPQSIIYGSPRFDCSYVIDARDVCSFHRFNCFYLMDKRNVC